MHDATTKLHRATTLGKRLRWLREFKELTLRQFAGRIRCDASYLSRLENDKAKHPSDRVLWMVGQEFMVNAAWLLDGDGDPFQSRSDDEKTKEVLPDWSEKRLQRIFAVIDELPAALATDAVLGHILPDLSVDELRTLLVTVCRLPNMSAPARVFWSDALGRLQGPRLLAEREKNDLTNTETAPITGEVKARLPSLLDDLKKATAEPGKKTALAEFLSKALGRAVPLASVSRWLSGEREPGGEIVLQMQAWLKRPT